MGRHLPDPPHRRFLISGPLSGILSDRFGARGFATAGLLTSGASFLLLELLPMNFDYVWFALLILLFALGAGMFFSPNQAAVMNSLPPDQRGSGAGMLNTFQNSASVLSIGVFFTIITLGLAATLPSHLYSGLVAQGVPSGAARTVSHLPPIGSLFAAFLGYNPIQQLLGNQHTLQTTYHLSAGHAQFLLGRSFFPRLIEQPFANGLHLAFDFAAGASVIAAIASLLRGGRYVHGDEPTGANGNGATTHESIGAEIGEGLAGAGVAAGTGSGAGEVIDESGVLTSGDD